MSGNSIVLVAEPLPKQALDSAVNPNEIVQQTFELERRGFDQRQVQQYLRAVADSLHDAQQRESDMRSRLGKAVRRAEAAEKALRDTPSNDPSELTRQIGDEVTTVLDAARAAGDQRIAAAEASAERLMSNAKAEATKIRGAAETIMDERRAEADVAAAEIITQGKEEAEILREEARAEAEEMRNNAAERIAHTRDECDALIAEAEEARAQILEDMERRRRQARAQVERLRVGRDRLLRSYDVVRRTLEETTVELKSSLQEAKVRGDTAARQVAGEPLASRAQLEAELADAKLIGKVRTPQPAVLKSPALPRRLDPPQVPNIDLRTESAPTPRKPKVAEPKRTASKTASPKAPAVAPTLKAAPEPKADADAAPTAKAEPEKQPEKKAVEETSIAPAAEEVPVWKPVEGADLEVAEADPKAADAEVQDQDQDQEVEPLDEELAQLEDHDLDVVEPNDEIEQVVALAAELLASPVTEATEAKEAKEAPAPRPAAPSLFAALRAQRGDDPAEAVEVEEQDVEEPEPEAADEVELEAADLTPEMESEAESTEGDTTEDAGELSPVAAAAAKRDAIVADSANQLERRLKRALADEQNDLLAGIRAGAKKGVDLSAIVGDIDVHLSRYVVAIHEVAVVAYGAGAELVDGTAREGELPAGAVEELLSAEVVLPIRERLASLDALEVESADMHLDPVRAFYRQRKTDHLGMAASRLAQLLCVSGACDALPTGAVLPWAPAT